MCSENFLSVLIRFLVELTFTEGEKRNYVTSKIRSISIHQLLVCNSLQRASPTGTAKLASISLSASALSASNNTTDSSFLCIVFLSLSLQDTLLYV